MRFWMHSTTRYCMGHLRPYVIQWNAEELTIFNYKITKDKFAAFLREQLTEFERFIESEVLLGLSPGDFGVSCEIHNDMDDGDLDTPGRGPFLPEATASLDNPDSRKFQRAMAEMASDRAPVRRIGNVLQWDKDKSTRWLLSIDMAWQFAYCLIHCLGGLAGRASEEALYNWTNELFGSPTNVRIRGHTVALNSTYHKGQLLTGMHKYIVRLLPYQLSRLLYILLRIIRPAELAPVLKFYTLSGEDYAIAAAKLYGTRMFVSWGKVWTPERMSKVLKSWFEKGLSIPMGVRMYRHLATALQRRYIQRIEHNQPEDIQVVADAQAGRTPSISQKHYAVEKNPSKPFKSQEFEMVSGYWHDMLGIKTYPPKLGDLAAVET